MGEVINGEGRVGEAMGRVGWGRHWGGSGGGGTGEGREQLTARSGWEGKGQEQKAPSAAAYPDLTLQLVWHKVHGKVWEGSDDVCPLRLRLSLIDAFLPPCSLPVTAGILG